METYRILVSEVTEYGSLRCVAGWDLDRAVMIRPEPAPGEFWQSDVVGPAARFNVGWVSTFSAEIPGAGSEYPHRTEDRVVGGDVKTERYGLHWRKALAASLSPDLVTLFDGNLQVSRSSAFIARGTKCRSLGALKVEPKKLHVYEDPGFEKRRLRCNITSGSTKLAVSITSLSLRSLYREKGVDAVQEQIAGMESAHVRLGLARAFRNKPDQCYLQVNDIHAA